MVLPPLLPSPSHHLAPSPSISEPEAPVTVMSVPDTEMRGPLHSSYPKVVVPSKMTCVPLVSLVRSSVVPDGTAILFKTIVAHDVFDLLALAAFVKVHVVALFSKFGAAVGAGAVAGAAATRGSMTARQPSGARNRTMTMVYIAKPDQKQKGFKGRQYECKMNVEINVLPFVSVSFEIIAERRSI